MIVVFGSLNMDLVMTVPALPGPGETVLTRSYATKPGGKGANQAVAAARAGASVAMVGTVGTDGFGDRLVENLQQNAVDVRCLRRGGEPTGVAYICVDSAAENFIAVASGANLETAAVDLPEDLLAEGGTLLMQMEVPADQIWAALHRARAAGMRTVLNVAPAAPVPADALRALDVLIVNEHEARSVASDLGIDGGGLEDLARRLAAEAGLVCVVTLGAAGSIAVEGDLLWKVAPLPVRPVDTTGAGDAFVGVLVAALDQGRSLPEALRRASVGAGLACLALGAQESLPSAADIDRRLADVPEPSRV